MTKHITERKTPAYLAAAKIVDEIFTVLRLNNSKCLIGVTAEDMEYQTQGLVDAYLLEDFDKGMAILRQAFQRLKVMNTERAAITMGDYNTIVHALYKERKALQQYESTFPKMHWTDRWRATNSEHLEAVANAPKGDSKAIKNYWMAKIKKDLQRGGNSMKTVEKVLPWLN